MNTVALKVEQDAAGTRIIMVGPADTSIIMTREYNFSTQAHLCDDKKYGLPKVAQILVQIVANT